MKRVFLISIIFISTIYFSFGQDNIIFKTSEDSLANIANNILNGPDDSTRAASNFHFKNYLTKVLNINGSYDYPFDSLITIAKIFSPDNKFRIYNWNLPTEDGTFEYFGIIQTRDSIYHLEDSSKYTKSPNTSILSHSNWYGAHYYKLIQNEYRSKTYYTLLGWDGNNNYSTKKIIDILTFDQLGTPVFGAPIFNKFTENPQCRIIFEYSSRVTMSLKYEEQSYIKIVRKKKSSKFVEAFAEMIVFDRLAPMDISLAGQYMYYAPFEGIFDAYIFEEGSWSLLEDINALNRDMADPSKETKPIEYDLVPPE